MRNSPKRAESCRDARGWHSPLARVSAGVLTQGKKPFWGEKRVKKEVPNQEGRAAIANTTPPALPGRSQGGSGMLELTGMVFPRVVPAFPGGKQEGASRPLVRLTHQTRGGVHSGLGGGAARIGSQGTARLRSKAMQNPTLPPPSPPSPGGIRGGERGVGGAADHQLLTASR